MLDRLTPPPPAPPLVELVWPGEGTRGCRSRDPRKSTPGLEPLLSLGIPLARVAHRLPARPSGLGAHSRAKSSRDADLPRRRRVLPDRQPSLWRGKRTILIKDPQTDVEEEHLIPIGKHVIVFKGDFVKKGQQLTEGPVDPHEILDICGPQELQEHLVNEVQEVYRLQGVTINDKHIEIIVRQMLRKVRVTEPGDTQFLWGEQIDKIEFEKENARVEKIGGKPAEAQPVLLGITKASLETESFLSAASFQDTTRVLTEAATMGKVDYLRRLQGKRHHGPHHPGGDGLHAAPACRTEAAGRTASRGGNGRAGGGY